MKNVQMMLDGDTLTIKVDLSKEFGPQIEEWQQIAERTRKQWEEGQWYLEEARASVRQLEEEIRLLHEAHGQLEARYREATAQLREAARQREEANWLLGEARASAEHLEQQTALRHEAHRELEARHREATAQLREAERQRDEANWYLGESRAAREGLLRNLDEMRRLADETAQRLSAEQAHRRRIEAELVALRTYGERRRASRMHRPDVTVELQGPDGAVVYHGPPRDVSRTGFGIASEYPIEGLPLQVRLYFSGAEHPVEATGRLAWQGLDPRIPHYLGGCELMDMAADGRETLERALVS